MATQAQSMADVHVGSAGPAAAARRNVRRLILHADDFGFNQAVTEGVLRGFRYGLLTSTAVLSNAPAAAEALAAWKHLLVQWQQQMWPSAAARRLLGDPPLPPDLGVHLNLTQGRPLSGSRYPAELLDAGGCFPGVWKLFFRMRHPAPAVLAAVKRELSQQIEYVLDHGIRPTHLNGHQYIELIPAIAELLPQLFDRYRIPVARAAVEPALFGSTVLAGFGPWVWLLGQVKRYYAQRQRSRLAKLGLAFPDVLFGTVHAGRICSTRLVQKYLRVCEDAKYVEIVLHPGEEFRAEAVPASGGDQAWRDPLGWKRPAEARLLVSAELVQCIAASGRRLGRLQQLSPSASEPSRLPDQPACPGVKHR